MNSKDLDSLYNKLQLVDVVYLKYYTEGWDARMADLFVCPYLRDFETDRYKMWKHGWDDCDMELKLDDKNDGSQLV